MMPALAQAWVFVTLLTRAMKTPSPVQARRWKWNSSAESQMSAPEPRMVNVPPDSEAEPAAATAPMSPEVNGPVWARASGRARRAARNVTDSRIRPAIEAERLSRWEGEGV